MSDFTDLGEDSDVRTKGSGVLDLGWAAEGRVEAKHRVKGVERFLDNGHTGIDAVSEAPETWPRDAIVPSSKGG